MGEAVDDRGFRLMARLCDRTTRVDVEVEAGSGGKASVWSNVSSGGAGRGGRAPTTGLGEAVDVSEMGRGWSPEGGRSRCAMVFIWECRAGLSVHGSGHLDWILDRRVAINWEITHQGIDSLDREGERGKGRRGNSTLLLLRLDIRGRSQWDLQRGRLTPIGGCGFISLARRRASKRRACTDVAPSPFILDRNG